MSEHTMRAVTIREFGGPEVLTVEEVARPEPLPTEVLVRVHAAGINPVDWKTRAGQGMAGARRAAVILGWDVSGVVEEVGFGVTTLRPATRCTACRGSREPAGGYAEYVTAPARQFARKPATLDHEQAAAVPLAALTAWQTLVDTAHVAGRPARPDHAAAGGVGHFAVQFARHLGAARDRAPPAPPATPGSRNSAPTSHRLHHHPLRGRRRATSTSSSTWWATPTTTTSTRSLTVPAPGRPAGRRTRPASPRNWPRPPRQPACAPLPFLVEPDGRRADPIAGLIDAGKVAVEVEEVFPLEEVGTRPRAGSRPAAPAARSSSP